MKITNGEIRGSIVLIAILAITLAIIWLCGPSAHAPASDSYPSDSTSKDAASVEYFTGDSALIASRGAAYEKSHSRRSHRSDSAKTRRHRKSRTSSRAQKAPASNRPSPLDSPAN